MLKGTLISCSIILATSPFAAEAPVEHAQPAAMAQGAHRLARGEKFFATARDAARQLNTTGNSAMPRA